MTQASLLPEASVSATQRRWGNRLVGLDELGRLVVVTAHAEGRVSHTRIRELTSQHSRDVTLKLQELVRNGFLVSSGERRATTYTLPAEPDETSVALEDMPLFQSKAAHEPRAENLSQSSRSLSQSSSSLSQSGPSLSQSNVAGPSATIAKVATQAWSPTAEVKSAILDYCREEFRTVSEISGALKRKPSTMRQNYIIALVADGQLELKYPAARNHPSQAYRTTKKASPADPGT